MSELSGGCSSKLDLETDRTSAATQGSAHSCCQPFESAPVTSGPAPAADGTGNTQQPVAWMVQNDDGERWMCHNHPAAAKYGLRCVPLFAKPQPTLTDEERQLFVRLEERFESLAHFFDTPSGVNRKAKEACDRDRRILKSLAERLA